MKKILCLLLCVWTVASRAGTEGTAEDGNPGAVNDQDEAERGLEDALSDEQNEMLVAGFERNEDEWREEPLLFGVGCQEMWPGQGCGSESGKVPRILDPDNPTSLRLRDSVAQDQEAENSPNTEDTPPSSADTITSRESLNLILPSDVMKLSAKKSVNVNLPSAASPDFHTTSTSSHLVSSSPQPSVTSKDTLSVPQVRDRLPNQSRPCPCASAPPSFMSSVRPPQIVRPPYVPASPPLPTAPWPYPPSGQPVPQMLQTPAPRLQIPLPAPTVSLRTIPVKRKVIRMPSRSILKRKKIKKVETKRNDAGCKPRCQSCQCSKPKPKPKIELVCTEFKPRKRSKKSSPCRQKPPSCRQKPPPCRRTPPPCRKTYVTKSKKKVKKSRTMKPSGCGKTKCSRQSTTSKLTPSRKEKLKKMLVYVA